MSKAKRERLKFVLEKLTDGNRNVFMRIYCPHNLELDINEVVDNLPTKNLQWALQQAENTYYKLFRILKA